MGGILDSITEWIREILTGAVVSNLSSMFGDVNDKVGVIAAEVRQTPAAWNINIFSMIRTLSENVILPIAGLIIAYILCAELIGMVVEKNSMHEVDTFMFFKYFFKSWVAIFIVTHTFDITMAVFDMAQRIKTRRNSLGLTQEQVAEKLKISLDELVFGNVDEESNAKARVLMATLKSCNRESLGYAAEMLKDILSCL